MAATNNIIHSGYMKKKGDFRWSNRFFELKLTPLPWLHMYEDRSHNLKHKLNCSTVTQIIRSDYQNIVLHFGNKKWLLYCETKSVADEWEKLFREFDKTHYQTSMVEYQLKLEATKKGESEEKQNAAAGVAGDESKTADGKDLLSNEKWLAYCNKLQSIPSKLKLTSLTLSADEREALKTMRTLLTAEENEMTTDSEAIRFLIAREFDAEKSAAMRKHDIFFRKIRNFERLRSQPTPKSLLLERLICTGSQDGCYGKDREGRIVSYLHQGHFISMPLYKSITMEEFLEFHIYSWEKTIQHHRDVAKKNEDVSDRMLLVVDLEGLKLQSRHNLKFLTYISALDEKHYPEIFSKIILVGCPRVFPVLFNLIKPMLPAQTKNKIHPYSDYESLHQYIDPSQLPKMYGGELEDSTVLSITDKSALSELEKLSKKPSLPDKITKLNLEAGNKSILSYECRANDEIEWWFRVKPGDILFAVHYQPTNPDEKPIEVRPIEKCGGEGHKHRKFAVESFFTCLSDGVVTIEFSNGHSKMKSKNLEYCITINHTIVSSKSKATTTKASAADAVISTEQSKILAYAAHAKIEGDADGATNGDTNGGTNGDTDDAAEDSQSSFFDSKSSIVYSKSENSDNNADVDANDAIETDVKASVDK